MSKCSSCGREEKKCTGMFQSKKEFGANGPYTAWYCSSCGEKITYDPYAVKNKGKCFRHICPRCG